MQRFDRDRIFGYARQGVAVVLASCFFSQQTVQAAGGGAATPVLPNGGAYVAGTGSIKSLGNAVTINQSSLRGIIDWNTFSIGQNGTVTFKNGNGATLNRVSGNQMSSILGSLFATGSVYVINPQGVLIGPGAHVNTGGDFLASTLDLSNDAFLRGGSLLFSGESKNLVVNLGDLFSADGSVFLIGHDIQNGGNIHAKNGTAGLAAGSEVLLKDSTADQRVFVQSAGGDLTNTGNIAAARAELKAKGGNIYALAGNEGGAISATGTVKINGDAWLISDGGSTEVTGTVSAQDADGKGGAIETSGHNLDISHATVKTGQGGNWLLDPVDLTIDSAAASTIQNSLATTSVTVQTSVNSASGPGNQSSGNGDITVASNIGWSSNNSLTFSAYHDVNVSNGVTIANTGAGNLTLRADNASTGSGTIHFTGTGKIDFSGSTGNVALLYNPSSYATPTDYTSNVLTNGAWTAPLDGSVTSQRTAYMLVNTSTDLQNLGTNVNGTYALGQDISLNSIANWAPLTQSGFYGILDGMGHTINNLTINDSTPDARVGLFGEIDGQVRNLTLTNASITETGSNANHMGVLAAHNYGAISNVSVSGTLTTNTVSRMVGGMFGENFGTIQNSNANVTIDASADTGSALLGGLTGESGGTISNSFANGSINAPIAASYSYVGGLVGYNFAAVTGSHAAGAVTAGSPTSYIGGLIGLNDGSPVTNSYATGAVTALASNNQVGGLLGYSSGAVTNSNASGTVSGGDSSYVGGLIGLTVSGGTVSGSYATAKVSGGNIATLGGLVGQSAAAIDTSYAVGPVTCTTNGSIGGLVGNSSANINTSYAIGAVTGGFGTDAGGLVGDAVGGAIVDTYARGAVTQSAGGGDAGGLIGYNAAAVGVTRSYSSGFVSGLNNDISSTGAFIGGSYGTATSSYFDSQINTLSAVGDGTSTGILGRSTSSLQSGSMPTGFNATNTVWTAPAGVYPYFGWQGPIVPISGFVSGPSGYVNNAAVSVLWKGAVVGNAVSNSNGYYAVGVPQNMIAGGFLAYLTSGGQANTFNDGYSVQPLGNSLILNTVAGLAGGSTTLSSFAESLATALNGQTGSNFLVSSSNGHLSFVRGTSFYLSALPAFTFDTSLNVPGFLFGASYNNLSIANGVSLTAGSQILLGTNAVFTNEAGPNALNVSGPGNWLVYSRNPMNDTVGGLVPAFKQYNTVLGGAPLGSGNGLLYTYAPVLTASLTGAVIKTYDGTSNATLAVGNLSISGAVPGDTVTLTPGTVAYANKNVGSSKTVTATGLLVAATSSGIPVYGYQLSSTSASANIGDITPATLTVGGTTTAANKTYDGTLTDDVSGGTISGIVTGDTVNFAQAGTFANKNAGIGKMVTYTNNISGTDASNYVLSSNGGMLTANIDPATLTVGGATTAANKTYDGTLTDNVSGGTISGVVTGDTVNFAQAGTFANKNAGTGKTVTYTNSISGTDEANYVLSSNGGTLIANIDPATLTVGGITTAANKTYDGTLTDNVSGGTISGIVTGDTVNFAQAGTFANKNAGTGKTVTYTNSISGTDAANYVLSSNGGTLTANIDPAKLYYTASDATRLFGASNPAFTGTVTGFVGGDTLASVTSGAPMFTSNASPSSNAGLYAINGGGLTLNTANYQLVQASGNADAFTIQPITITIANAIKVAGDPNPTFSVSYSGPETDYLKSLLANLTFVTNAPSGNIPGVYQITALIPSALAGSIMVLPGSFTITANSNVMVVNSTPQVVSTIPAALETQPPTAPTPLPNVNGGTTIVDPTLPSNAVSHFQIVFPTTLPNVTDSTTLQSQPGAGNANDSLSIASFMETSPDGHTKGNKSTYAAGAQK